MAKMDDFISNLLCSVGVQEKKAFYRLF